MKRYVHAQSVLNRSLAEVEKFAQSIMKHYGRSTVCNIVSEEIEKEYGLKKVQVTIFNNGEVFDTLHYCNILDNSYLCDFTGDQFVGDSKSSQVWIYHKNKDSEIYVSRDRKTSEELSAQYPTIQSIMSSEDDSVFGIQLS